MQRIRPLLVSLRGGEPNGIPGAVTFALGVDGVTRDYLNAFMAQALSAYTTGHPIFVYYDNSTAFCYGGIVSNGGYTGVCP